MKEFKEYVQGINQKLDLPQPTKSKILLEIYYDLLSSYETYKAEGLDTITAISKSKETFGLSQQNLAALVEIHQSGFRRIVDRISSASWIPMEKIIVTIIFIMIGLLSISQILKGEFMEYSSLFIYPIILAFFVILCISGWKLYRLYIRKDHKIKTLRNGMGSLGAITAAIAFLGVSGYVMESYWAAQSGLYLGPFYILTFTGDADMLMGMTKWMAKTASLMVLCLTCTLFAGMFWQILNNKIQRIECEEAQILLAE